MNAYAGHAFYAKGLTASMADILLPINAMLLLFGPIK